MVKLFLKVYSSSLFYSVATAIEAMVPFVLAIILTRYISLDSYGIWDLFVIIAAFMRPFITLSIHDALKMRYLDFSKSQRMDYLGTSFLFTAGLAVIVSAITYINQDALAGLMKFPPQWLVAAVLCAYLYGVFQTLLTYNQFAHKRITYIVLQITQSVFSIGIITYLVLAGFDWQGVIVGKITALFITCLIGVTWFIPHLRIKNFVKPDKDHIQTIVKFGVYYLPTGLGLLSVGLIDRFVITSVYDVSANSLYAIADLFGKVLLLVITSFMLGWTPWLFKTLKTHTIKSAQVLSISTSFFILLPIAGGTLFLISKIAAPILIGDAFHDAFIFIPWAIAAAVSQGYFLHNQAFLHFRKKVLFMSIASVIAVTTNIILSLILVYPYGISGVFAATVISYVLAFMVNLVLIALSYKGQNEQLH